MYLYRTGTSDIYNNSWLAADVVEDWTSLIWTERYTEHGEFQLKTPAIAETLALIPDGSHLCINDSREIMRVESHVIGVNADGVMEATISGRSLETFLENRNVNADTGIPYSMLQEYTVQEALGVLIYNAVTNPLTVDVTGSPVAHESGQDLGHEVNILDSIVLQKSQSTGDPPDITDLQSEIEWYLENGDVYKFVLDWLRLGDLGLRTSRPKNSYPTRLAVTDLGVVSNPSSNAGDMTMVWDIYNGRNRSINPSPLDPLDPVIFRYDAGHIENPSYLLSRKGYKNYARVVSSDGELAVWDGDDAEGIWAPPEEGINRYELNLDLGTLDVSISDPFQYMRQKGKTELSKLRRQNLIDGAISANAPYEFGVDYNLGDLVTVMGEFGVVETMRINEYVRSQDKDGYKAYPTLIRPDLIS